MELVYRLYISQEYEEELLNVFIIIYGLDIQPNPDLTDFNH